LDAFQASKRVSHLSCQFLEFCYISIYIVVFELEFSNLCSGSVFSCSIQVLNFEFLKEEVP
jgi:hypothetical protein